MKFNNLKRGTLLLSKNKENSYYNWAILSGPVNYGSGCEVLLAETCSSRLVVKSELPAYTTFYTIIERK